MCEYNWYDQLLKTFFPQLGAYKNIYKQSPRGPTRNKEFLVQIIFVFLFAVLSKLTCERKYLIKGIIIRCGLEGKRVISHQF